MTGTIKPRGRPPKTAEVTTDTVTAKTPRPKRVPIGGVRYKLNVNNKDPNYFYYWAKEEGDWIQALKLAGYQDVSVRDTGNVVGEELLNGEVYNSLDDVMRVHGGYGERGPYKLRLMRQHLDDHKEDQALEAARIDATDTALRRQEFDGRYIENKYGDVSISVRDTE